MLSIPPRKLSRYGFVKSPVGESEDDVAVAVACWVDGVVDVEVKVGCAVVETAVVPAAAVGATSAVLSGCAVVAGRVSDSDAEI